MLPPRMTQDGSGLWSGCGRRRSAGGQRPLAGRTPVHPDSETAVGDAENVFAGVYFEANRPFLKDVKTCCH